jgi:hypothetical protein
VLVDTEKDGHRVSFNKAFQQKGRHGGGTRAASGLGPEGEQAFVPHFAGIPHDWDVPTYGKLLEIGGGKERMTHYFSNREGEEPFKSVQVR